MTMHEVMRMRKYEQNYHKKRDRCATGNEIDSTVKTSDSFMKQKCVKQFYRQN